jgi:GNAT superfamily N-acetyltransferase
MTGVIVRSCSYSDIEGNRNFPALAHEYAEECAIAGLPAPDEKIAAYRALAASEIFQAFGAFLENKLVGFIVVLKPVIPHYGVAIAVTESFFVGKEYRKSGAGLKLLRAAEAHAEGAPGLLVSAPVGGTLAEVLPHLGYRETNRVFFKELAHG